MTIKQTSPRTNKAIEQRTRFLRDVLQGLKQEQKTLPCKYLYDQRGSQLFDQICELEEYYPTRTELAIMQQNVGEMVESIGKDSILIELGSGSSLKTRTLLDEAATTLTAYVPVDISKEHLLASADQIQDTYPDLNVVPVHADFTQPFVVFEPENSTARRVAYFPGSTIGNFRPENAMKLLERIHDLIQPDGGLLIGMDRKKDVAILEAAYNDAKGVTAAFNMNILKRINRELEGDFDLNGFHHRAVWVEEQGCMQMRLYSKKAQDVHLHDETIHFEQDEWILTEHSHKYDLDQVRQLMSSLDYQVEKMWTDDNEWFSIWYLSLK